MADGGNEVRRRGEAPERFDYRHALENLANFIDNERPLRPRPDDGEWRVQRSKTIETLNELRRKLDTICVGANYGKATGNIAEITGAATNIVGACMALGGLPSAEKVTSVGNLVHHSGTFMDGVSNVVESLVSANYLNEIEAVLEKDKELSLPLRDWLEFSRELDVNVETIFGVSIASEKLNTVMKVFHEFAKLNSSVRSFDATIKLMKQGRYSVHIGNDVKLEKLKKFFEQLSVSPQLADRMRLALSVLSTSTGAIQVARDGVEAYNSVMGTSSSDVPTLLGGQNLEIPTIKTVSTFCVFQTINIAISFISLINAASVIRKGTSNYSDGLKQLTRSLAWELRQMENL